MLRQGAQPSRRRILVGGNVDPARDIYLERPEDRQFLNLIIRGEYVNLFCARQSGKSSLMVKTCLSLRQAGWRTALIDLSVLSTANDSETYFRGLVSGISDFLEIMDYAAFWERRTFDTPPQKFLAFATYFIPERVNGPVAIFLDEVDLVFKQTFADEIFFAIRSIPSGMTET